MGLVDIVDPRPLVLTLQLDDASHNFFTEQRLRFFPPERNFLDAHVTLFHQLPAEQVVQISADLSSAVKSENRFSVQVTGLRSLGRGVAYSLYSPKLIALREDLARRWSGWLSAQDSQKFQPHVTVQNKVAPREAQETLALLQAAFTPCIIQVNGFNLWRYDGGPWQPVSGFSFAGKIFEATIG